MYLQYFRLRELPFTLTPNTQFYLDLPPHQEALNLISVALAGGEGFIKVVGEIGTGKTMLCRQVLNSVEGCFETAYVPNPMLSPRELVAAICAEFGVWHPANAGMEVLTRCLNQRLIELVADSRSPVLIVDEAQAMPVESLETIRLLTNLETERQKLLQIVLLGQPELDVLLGRDDLRQLRQRITFSCSLRPMSRKEIAAYIGHRLARSGHQGPPLFRPQAIRALHRATGGVPRLVNILAHKSLMLAWGRGADRIDAKCVRTAAGDTEGIAARRSGLRWLPPLLAVGCAGAVAVLWHLAGTLV